MKCFIAFIMMFATAMSANAQNGADPCQPLYVIHLKDGSEIEATNVKMEGSHCRATVLMRGAWVPRIFASDEVERVVKADPAAGVSAGRIVVEMLAGLGLGTLAFVVVSATLETTMGEAARSDTERQGGDPGEAMIPYMLVFAVPSFVIGNAYGVYLVGNTDRETGSFGATLLGSAIGVFAYGIGAPVGATIAFNMTRRSKCVDAQAGAALFDVDRENGRFALGAPRVSNRVSTIDGAMIQWVDVLRVRF